LSGGTVTLSHTNATTTSTVSIPDLSPVATITRRHDSFWTMSTSGIAAGTWSLRAGGTNFGTIASNADLRMATSSGVVGTNAAGSGGPTDWRVNRTGIAFASLANSYHVASTDATNSPLPIELIDFTAKLNNDVVDLNWSTASELNNDFFTIERAIDIEHFEPIETIAGSGTTTALHKYGATDITPSYGRSYYRLKQTDFDGHFTYSDLAVVNYDGPRFSALKVYPNPSQGSNVTITVVGLKGQTSVPVQIYDVQGRKVYEQFLEVATPGTLKQELVFGSPLQPGLYIIRAGNTLQLTQKIQVD